MYIFIKRTDSEKGIRVTEVIKLSFSHHEGVVTVYLNLPDFGYNILQTLRKHRSFSGNIQREKKPPVLVLLLFTRSELATDFQQLTALHAGSRMFVSLVKETSHLWEKPT
jgi:hypothetical protein